MPIRIAQVLTDPDPDPGAAAVTEADRTMDNLSLGQYDEEDGALINPVIDSVRRP